MRVSSLHLAAKAIRNIVRHLAASQINPELPLFCIPSIHPNFIVYH